MCLLHFLAVKSLTDKNPVSHTSDKLLFDIIDRDITGIFKLEEFSKLHTVTSSNSLPL